MDETVAFAMPTFEPTIMIAPPITIAAVIGAAPPAEIVFAPTEFTSIEFAASVAGIHAVTVVRAIPTMPATVVETGRFAITIPVAAAIVIALAMACARAILPVMKLDGGHGVEGVQQN